MYDTGQLRVQFNTMACVVCKNVRKKNKTQCRATNDTSHVRNENNKKCIQLCRRDMKNIGLL